MKILLIVLFTIGVAFADSISELEVQPEINSDHLDNAFPGKDGSNSPCSGKACKITERTCEPGETFMHYCNVCRCGTDGSLESSMCTRMGCGKGWNKDGTMIISKKQEIELSPRSKRQVKAHDLCDHEDCSCNEDGTICAAAGHQVKIFSLVIVGSLLVTLLSRNYQR